MRKLLLLCALLLPLTAIGQTLVNGGSCTSGLFNCNLALNGSGSTSFSVTSGNSMFVKVDSDSTSPTLSVSTNNGSDTITPLCGGRLSNGTLYTEIFQVVFASTTSSETITAASSTDQNYMDAQGVQYSSVGSVGTCTTNTAITSTTSLSDGPTPTTTSANAVILASFAAQHSGSSTFAAGSPYTLRQSNWQISVGGAFEDQTVTSTGTYSATATVSNSASYAIGIILPLYYGVPTVSTPTFSQTNAQILLNQVAITSGTSGPTICYTLGSSGVPQATTAGTCNGTDSVGSTEYSISNGGVTSVLSSSTTIKAIGTLSGDANSAVASESYTPYLDQPIFGLGSTVSEPFSEYFDADYYVDAVNDVPTQKPLIPLGCAQFGGSCTTISSTQVAAWTGMGYGSSGMYLYPSEDATRGAGYYGVRGPASGFGYSTFTGATIPANQEASMYYHANTGGYTSGIAVGTNCTPGSAFSGNTLQVGSASTDNVQLFINGSLNNTITLAPSEGDVYEMRQYGNACQPTKNGAQVTGLSATYSCIAATEPPCIGAEAETNIPGGTTLASAPGYNPSIGAVATSNPGVSPISYTPTYYSTVSTGTVTSSTVLSPVNWTPTSGAIPTAGLIVGNSGNALSTTYALGGSLGNLALQGHPLAPFTNTQYAHWVNDMDVTAWPLNNDFGQLQSQPFVAPSFDTALTTAGGGACNDTTSIYCGAEPEMQGENCIGTTLEYECTHRFHCTYANNASSSLAVATATISGGAVNSITVNASTIPVISSSPISTCNAVFFTKGGPGSGAAATCSISGSTVSLTLTSGGSGYTSAPGVYAIPTSGAEVGCSAYPNYNVRTALGFEQVLMHGDEVLGLYNSTSGLLSVYAKGGSTIPGWTASTTVTPMVQTSTSGTTGTTIQAAGLYQVAGPTTFQGTFPYPLNGYLNDGTNWQKVTTAGTSAVSAPTWNATLLGTTTSGSVTFTNEGPHPSLGTCTDPCTAASDTGYVWGGTVSTCETQIFPNGIQALTVDNTVIWRCVGEALTNDTAFQFLGSAIVPGFTNGAPGMWSKGNFGASNYPFEFGSFDAGSGNPCGSTYTCVGGTQNSYIGWWGQLRVPDEQFRLLPEYVLAAVQRKLQLNHDFMKALLVNR